MSDVTILDAGASPLDVALARSLAADRAAAYEVVAYVERPPGSTPADLAALLDERRAAGATTLVVQSHERDLDVAHLLSATAAARRELS